MSDLHPIPSADDIIVSDCRAIEFFFLMRLGDRSADEIRVACKLTVARFNNARRVLRKVKKLATSEEDITKFAWKVTE